MAKQSYAGQNAYKAFKEGKKITRKESMLAKCYECMSEYDNGKEDCLGKSCPIYPFYPYLKK
jgi:hypothetical protein